MRAAILVFLGTLWLTPTLGADVLVLRDGSRVETRGTWEIKGAMVVFTLPSGALGSLRSREVDLDASAAATAAARAPKVEPPPPPKRPVVLTLTDDDVADAPEIVAPTEGTEAVAPEGAQTPTSDSGVTVVIESWEESFDAEAGGVQISGILRNTGSETAAGLTVLVKVRNADGEPVPDGIARVGTQALNAGRTSGFSVSFPGLNQVSDVRFEVRHRTLLFGRDASAPPPAAPAPPAGG